MLIKQINKDIQVPIVFIELKLNISEYKNILISDIEKGIVENSNMNFKTNVKGRMTAWDYFNNNTCFKKILIEAFNEIENIFNFPECALCEAWGIKIEEGEKTNLHNHFERALSGILYLNKSDLPIKFPEIKVEIKPEEGTFLLFSGLLKHGTSRSKFSNPKYAIPFNFNIIKDWDKLK